MQGVIKVLLREEKGKKRKEKKKKRTWRRILEAKEHKLKYSKHFLTEIVSKTLNF
jgi:hypothetical protein